MAVAGIDEASSDMSWRRRLANAVPGVLSWTIIVCTVLGVALFPGQWLLVVTIFLVWIVFRMSLMFFGVLIGELRIRKWERVDWIAAEDLVRPASGLSPSQVRHVVFVPNYKEPGDVIARTLASLAAQHRASERIVVVMAVEEREAGARQKAQELLAPFEGSFLATLVTVHPGGLPGELPGKSSNLFWAAPRARELVDELGLDPDVVTMSACDSDSVFHPDYFAALSRLFAEDSDRLRRFWHAPLRYYNNLRKVPYILRLDLMFVHSSQMALLSVPQVASLPISTYSLSLRLAEDAGWWDPGVIAEDWHMFLRSYIAKRGDVETVGIYLPTWSDIVEGSTWAKALKARYEQVFRHSWGAEDVGYLLVALPGSEVPKRKQAMILGYVLHDHVLRAVIFLMMFSGTLLMWKIGSTNNVLFVIYWLRLGWILRGLYITASALFIGTIALEVYRRGRAVPGPTYLLLAETVGSWIFLPLIGILAGWLPALHAQTRLMLGMPLNWKVAPKKLASSPGTS